MPRWMSFVDDKGLPVLVEMEHGTVVEPVTLDDNSQGIAVNGGRKLRASFTHIATLLNAEVVGL